MRLSADLAAVCRTLESWPAAFNSGDASALAARAFDNAVLLPDDGSFLSGREAIRPHYQTGFEEFVPATTASGEVAEVVGDRTFYRGSCAVTRTLKVGGKTVQARRARNPGTIIPGLEFAAAGPPD